MNTKPLIAALDSVLRPQGFFRHKHTWNRKIPPFVDAIDFQKRLHTDDVTINCGILHPDAYRICWGREILPTVYTPNCPINVRIGALIDNYERWWKYENGILPVDEIAEKVEIFVLPFLDKLHSVVEMENYLVQKKAGKIGFPEQIILLATLQLWRGDKDAATKTLNTFYKTCKSTSWKEKLKTIAREREIALEYAGDKT